jgi:hypothetical protein
MKKQEKKLKKKVLNYFLIKIRHRFINIFIFFALVNKIYEKRTSL